MPRRQNPTRKGATDIDLYTEWLKKIMNASKDKIILCHHKKDTDVLASLGANQTNLRYYTKPETDLLANIADTGKECVLLFDANRPANEVCARITTQLQQHGVKTNTRLRKVLLTGDFKELSGLFRFLHKKVANTTRKHEGVQY